MVGDAVPGAGARIERDLGLVPRQRVLTGAIVAVVALGVGCSTSTETPGGGQGGGGNSPSSDASGGRAGAAATGGVAGAGGAPSTGGAPLGTGGAVSTGGVPDAGVGGTSALDAGTDGPSSGGASPCVEIGDATTRVAPHPGAVASYVEETPYQQGPQEIRVLLPSTYQADRRYRVLYVLPVATGRGDTFGDGFAVVQGMNVHDRYDVIVVQPNFAVEPWYGDHATDPGVRQASYMVEYVVPFVERSYAVCGTPESRLLVGFSKSGWGAFSLALGYPDVFGYAAAWDAPLMIATFQFGMQQVFGTQAQLDAYRPDLLAADRAASFRDRTRLVLTGQFLWGAQVTAYHDLLDGVGVLHDYDPNVTALHVWDAVWLEPTLAKLMALGQALAP